MGEVKSTREELLEELHFAQQRIKELEERERLYLRALDSFSPQPELTAGGTDENGNYTSICSHCKKISDASGTWKTPEKYFGDAFGMIFSHSICTDCVNQLYPDLFDIDL